MAAIAFESVFPLYYAVVTSLKSGTEVFQVDYWPRSFSLDNYSTVLTQGRLSATISSARCWRRPASRSLRYRLPSPPPTRLAAWRFAAAACC